MKGLFVTPPIRRQVLPIHSVACYRLEGDAHFWFFLFITSNSIAFQKLTPFPPPHIWHPDPRKLGPSPFTLRIDVYHEGAHSISFSTGTTPVVVVLIMASYSISLGSQTLDMKSRIPTLEISCSVLDTADNIITVYECDF
jgi:hypothetical protein